MEIEEWNDEQRAFYRKYFRFMLVNQPLMTHPTASVIDEPHWETICHNAAVLATDMKDGGNLEIVGDDGSLLSTTERAMTLQ